jgi:hypothetical protein|tara:strand:+ start:108 stop:719 length:612 start_codon:yes stop_codon:yes gene_type:complete
MGRPINKKHIGDGAGKIQVTAMRFAAGSEIITEGHIISQRSSTKFNVTDGSKTEILTLVNKDVGSLAAGEMVINAVDGDGVEKQITKLMNRTIQVEGDSVGTWQRDSDGLSTAVEKVITGISSANPAVVTSNGHALPNGTKVSITKVVGMVEVNNGTFTVAGTATNTFQLDGINSSGFTSYTSGGVVTVASTTSDFVIDKQAS